MSKPLRSRRFLALAAAYVVALHALLLPLTVAAFAAPDGSLCLSAASEGPDQPKGHDSGSACAAGCGMQCCVQSVAGPPPEAVSVAPSIVFEEIAPRTAKSEISRPFERGPHRPRAPPSA